MPERSDAAVLKDFSSSFTAQTPLGAIARVGAVTPVETAPTAAEVRVPAPRVRVHPVRHTFLWRRVLLVIAVGAALAVPVSLGTSGATADGELADPVTTGSAAVGSGPGGRVGEGSVPGAAVAATPLFAGVDQVRLALPAPEVTRIGYHEASFPNALAITPLGTNVDNQNTTKFTAGDPGVGPDYLVLSSRGRPNPATSAVDVVMPEGTPVASVVTGQVSAVEPYLLYGRHADTKIEIIPDGRPDLRVVLIHVAEVGVRPGDRVEAGRTILAGTPNVFPFSSHIDRYAEGTPEPHVHIEVKVPDAAPS